MKKFILFCLSACLLGMLLLGCPQDTSNQNGTENTTTTSTTTTTTISYSIAFNSNGGTGSMNSIVCHSKEKITLPACTFTGPEDTMYLKTWSTNQDGTGKKYAELGTVTDLSKVDGDTVTLYAQWTQCTEPGTIQPMPTEVNTLIAARNLLNPTEDEIVFFYWRKDGVYTGWSMWMWSDGGDGKNNWDAICNHGYSTIDVDGQKVGYLKFNTSGTTDNDCIALTGEELKVIQEKKTFNFLAVKGKSGSDPDWSTKDPGPDMKWELMEGNCFGMISGSSDVYSIAEGAKPQLMNAIQLTDTELLVGLSTQYAITITPSSNGFSVESESGKTLTVKDAYAYSLYGDFRFPNGNPSNAFRGQYNFQKQFLLTIDSGFDYSEKWFLKHTDYIPETGLLINAGAAAKNKSSEAKYTGDDLGISINGSKAGFKVFAPVASEANVLLYESWTDVKTNIDNISGKQTTTDELTNGTRVAMSKASDFAATGVWQVSNVDITGKNYYVYELNNFKTIYRVCDINALVASPDSIAAQIISIDDDRCKPTGWEASYTNPFGNSGADTKAYTEAIIYEMHIRDWSKGLDENNIGKFDEITAGLGTNGDGILGQHLKDLGITHVQILPMFDYAEKNSDPDFNWGYNPYHYNVPEGRYVNNHDNGGNEAVKQMRAMIKAFHDAGIAVNMDVVYNHTNGTGFGSLYDMTVPYYYYRLSSGSYSNGSGCGNETDSSMPMFRKYMIDSLSHWMNDYHINGFRFDLMGLHEAETMEEVYTALSKIDKNVMVYGEPWTGGTSPVVNSCTKAGAVGNAGYGAFDDSFRDAIKGGEFGGFKKGQVQGALNDSAILTGLQGLSTNRNETDVKGLSLHYVECHDNYTLFDKLDISLMNGEDKEAWKAYDELTSSEQDSLRTQDKLAAAYILLSQGTPFMNGGQEFMRTKQGDENSYKSSDIINAIDLSFKDKYNDVYKVYKGLIALRKQYDAFTKGSSVAAETLKSGLTKYTTVGTNGEFCVYYNASGMSETIDTTGYAKVIDITGGTLSESTSLPTTIGGKDFVILKK